MRCHFQNNHQKRKKPPITTNPMMVSQLLYVGSSRRYIEKIAQEISMKTGNPDEGRIWLWAMLLSSLTGTLIWFIQELSAVPFSQWGQQTEITFSYFTELSNVIIIIMATVLLFGRGRLFNWFKSPSVQSACCLYILSLSGWDSGFCSVGRIE